MVFFTLALRSFSNERLLRREAFNDFRLALEDITFSSCCTASVVSVACSDPLLPFFLSLFLLTPERIRGERFAALLPAVALPGFSVEVLGADREPCTFAPAGRASPAAPSTALPDCCAARGELSPPPHVRFECSSFGTCLPEDDEEKAVVALVLVVLVVEDEEAKEEEHISSLDRLVTADARLRCVIVSSSVLVRFLVAWTPARCTAEPPVS